MEKEIRLSGTKTRSHDRKYFTFKPHLFSVNDLREGYNKREKIMFQGDLRRISSISLLSDLFD